MDVRNDGDAFTGAKKKHKKRKNNEVGDLRLRGEEDNLQLADEDRPKKKKKTKVLGYISKGVLNDVDCGEDVDKSSRKEKKKEKKEKDISRIEANAQGDLDFGVDINKSLMTEEKKKDDDTSRINVNAQGNVDFGLGTDKSSRKEKEKKGISRIDVNAQGDDSKKVDKIRKDKTRNSGEPDIELMKRGEEHAREERHVKSKKKKNQRELKNEKQVNDNVGDSNVVDNQTCYAIIEKTQPVKSKKQKNTREDLRDVSLSNECLGNSYVHAVKGGGDSKNEQVEKKHKPEKCKKAEFAGAVCDVDGDSVDNQFENVKEKKRKKKKKDDPGFGCLDEVGKSMHVASIRDSKKSRISGSKKREKKSLGYNTEGDANASTWENNDKNETSGHSEKSYHNKKSKNVKFSDNVEVIHLPEDMSKGKEKKLEDGSKKKKTLDDGLIRGKRFSKEEDDMVKNAVYKYIEHHHLGEEGLEMVLECKSHPELKDCWKEIGEALPWRPHTSVYYRAHVLFEQSEARKWTPEELELLKKFYEKHGPDWKTLGNELGKHRFHVKDAWRRIKLPNMKKGNWSQEEYQSLFNLVNLDLSMKAFTEKKTKHGMIRDNIGWEAISEQLSTRSNSLCCMKWYRQLTSSMVAEGEWANVDDYRLLLELIERDAACEEDVDWDNLLEHRSGDLCRKRWNQMVRHIGEHGTKSFTEQVEILSQRYCPKLLEARESYDSRPPDD